MEEIEDVGNIAEESRRRLVELIQKIMDIDSKEEAETILEMMSLEKEQVDTLIKVQRAKLARKENSLREGKYLEKKIFSKLLSQIIYIFSHEVRKSIVVWSKKFALSSGEEAYMKKDLHEILRKCVDRIDEEIIKIEKEKQHTSEMKFGDEYQNLVRKLDRLEKRLSREMPEKIRI